MNDFMSGGLHPYWKEELLKMTGVRSMAGAVRRRSASSSWNESRGLEVGEMRPLLSILDVAGGTGDVAFCFVDAANCVERCDGM